MEITDQSFNIVDIKPANMEELTEVEIPDHTHDHWSLDFHSRIKIVRIMEE